MTIVAPADNELLDPAWAQQVTDAINNFESTEADLQAQLDALTAGWSTWSSSPANITVGSGIVTAKYRDCGNETVHFLWQFTLGAGSAVGTGPNFTLPPVTPELTLAFLHIGIATLIDAGTAHYLGAARLNSATVAEIIVFSATGSFVSQAGVSATAPFTWTSGDSIVVVGTYKKA